MAVSKEKIFCLNLIKKIFLSVSILLLYLILTPLTGLCQEYSNLDIDKKPGQYILKKWNTENGLTSESTNDLIQSNDGYIWIGTYTGLHRFDGKNMTVFTSSNSDLPSPNVLRIEIDSKGTLWLGTLHGVSTYKDNQFITPKALESVKDYSIEAIHVGRNDDVWFSTKSNHLFRYKNNILTNFTDEFNVTKNTVLSIEEAPDGTIYIGNDGSHLYSFNKGKINQIRFNEDINGINKIIANQDNIYIGTGKGLYIIQDQIIKKAPFLQNTAVYTLVESQNKVLWIGTMNGLYRYNQKLNKLDSITEEQGLPNNIIRDLHFDKQGNLWAGTYRSGIFFLSDASITSFSTFDGLSSNIITGVTEIAENTFLLGAENGILNLLEAGEMKPFNPDIPIPDARLKHLYTDRNNRIWVSTYAGLVLIEGTKSKQYNIRTGFPDNFIRQVYEDSKGHIWVGTKNAGLIKFKKNLQEWNIINLEEGLSSNYIMSITENDKNQLIVGTLSGINIIENDIVIKTITIDDGLPSNFSFGTYPTEKYLWIASNDGLSGYSEDKTVVFNTENGFPFNIVYDVIGDKDGNLWLPGEKAILKIKIKDLEAAADAKVHIVEVSRFDKSHGMKNNQCLGGVHSFKDKSDNIWIPTQGGIVYLKTDKIKSNKADIKIIIENINADNNTIRVSENIVIPSNTNRLDISFTGIDYKNIDKLQFRYKLYPFDDNWIYAGIERHSNYTNLAHGDYEFILQAGINNNYLFTSDKLNIHIESAWWQKLWARIVLGLIIILLGFSIYSMSIRALRNKTKRLEKMVNSRTSELEKQKHDLTIALKNLSDAQEHVIQSEKMATLGVLAAGVAHEMNNPLNFINGGLIGLEQYYVENDNDIKANKHLPKLLNAIKVGVERASAIVASLNEFSRTGKNTQEECKIHRIIDNCLIMLDQKVKNKVEIIKDYQETEPIVLGNAGKLHQVFLNIINNGIQAINEKGRVTIKTESNEKNLILSISDTGKGIKQENLKNLTEPFYTTKAPGEGTGLGLSIAYKIIKEHSGSLTFNSEPNKGTTAVLSLPIAVKNQLK